MLRALRPNARAFSISVAYILKSLMVKILKTIFLIAVDIILLRIFINFRQNIKNELELWEATVPNKGMN